MVQVTTFRFQVLSPKPEFPKPYTALVKASILALLFVVQVLVNVED